MGKYIAEQTIKQMIKAGLAINGTTVNVLGITFKENVPDIRNSKVVDLIRELQSYGVRVLVADPRADESEVREEYGLELVPLTNLPIANALILAVPHREYLSLAVTKWGEVVAHGGVVIDVKSCLDQRALNNVGISVWRL